MKRSSGRYFAFLFLVILFATRTYSLSLNEKLTQRENIVIDIAHRIRDFYDSRCTHISSYGCDYDSCQSTLDDTSCNDDAQLEVCSCDGMLMSNSHSSIRLPSAVTDSDDDPEGEIKDSIIYSKKLDPVFIETETLYPDTEWQGFGSWDGIFRIFPGRAQEECGDYDPRMRSWYAAAASGPKDVVLVIDKSGSMDDDGRWGLATDAVKAVLKTLNWMDFVGVVVFDGVQGEAEKGAEFLTGKSYLVSATKDNKDDILEDLEDLKPGGYTNFEAGFKKAFDMITNSRNANAFAKCLHSTAILFLTDGDITVGRTGTELHNYINSLNDNLVLKDFYGNAVIFTFSLGEDADTTNTKSIACATDGIWQDVPDGGDLAGVMSAFYNYFSVGMADGKNRTTWVQPYEFATDGTKGTSVSMPVYNYRYDPPLLLGVVGTGISMEALGPESDARLGQLIAEAKFCPEWMLTKCQMEVLRKRNTGVEGLCHPVADCSDTTGFFPTPCYGYEYPEDDAIWCNRKDKDDFETRACCCESNDGLYALFALVVLLPLCPSCVLVSCLPIVILIVLVVFIISSCITAICGSGGVLFGGGATVGGGGLAGVLAWFGIGGDEELKSEGKEEVDKDLDIGPGWNAETDFEEDEESDDPEAEGDSEDEEMEEDDPNVLGERETSNEVISDFNPPNFAGNEPPSVDPRFAPVGSMKHLQPINYLNADMKQAYESGDNFVEYNSNAVNSTDNFNGNENLGTMEEVSPPPHENPVYRSIQEGMGPSAPVMDGGSVVEEHVVHEEVVFDGANAVEEQVVAEEVLFDGANTGTEQQAAQDENENDESDDEEDDVEEEESD